MNASVVKLVIAVVLDVIDFTIGRIPGFELIVDAALGVAAVALWGWAGVFAFWELVPTLTSLALSQMKKGGKGKARFD